MPAVKTNSSQTSMVNCTHAVANVTVVPVSDDFDTYYLVQKSRTGYVYVTYYATRRREEAMRHLHDNTPDFWHHRVLNIKTGQVLKILRPGMD
jgi:hypothetical protein